MKEKQLGPTTILIRLLIINRKALFALLPTFFVVAQEKRGDSMKAKALKELTVKGILFFCAAFSIVIVLSIIIFLLNSGEPAVLGFFLHGLSIFNQPDFSEAGNGLAVLSSVDSTVYLATGGTALAFIIGLPCAIYMAEFADMRIRNFTKTSLEVLDGLPSIVIGIIGFNLLGIPASLYSFSGFLHRQLGFIGEGCGLYAWLILMIMTFPIIATLSEDALRAVPQDLREASLGVGATKWQTTTQVLIPTATPRILTAVLLALASAMGEMVAIYWVLKITVPTALLNSPFLILNPLEHSQTLSIILENSYTSTLDGFGAPDSGVFAVGLALFVMIGIVNIVIRIVLQGRSEATAEQL